MNILSRIFLQFRCGYNSRELVDKTVTNFFKYGFSMEELLCDHITAEDMDRRMFTSETQNGIYDMFLLIYRISGSKHLKILKTLSYGKPPHPQVILRSYLFTAFPNICFGTEMNDAEYRLFQASQEFVTVLHQIACVMRNLNYKSMDDIDTEIGYCTVKVFDEYFLAWQAWNQQNVTNAFQLAIQRYNQRHV